MQGDAYIAVAGIEPSRDGSSDETFALRIADVALEMLEALQGGGTLAEALKDAAQSEHGGVEIRVGLHAGPLVGGVIGTGRPKYTLLGRTVTTGVYARCLTMGTHVDQGAGQLHKRTCVSTSLVAPWVHFATPSA